MEHSNTVYTLDELRERVAPVAKKHGLPAIYVFGSYARGEADEDSDVDFLIDRTGTGLRGLFALGGLYNDLQEAVGKSIDIVTTSALEQEDVIETRPSFLENLGNEKVRLYKS